MQRHPFFHSEIHVPRSRGHAEQELHTLKAEVDRHNLTDMWNMILLLDYQVANVHELSPETKDEFRGIVSLLLKAFAR